MNDIYFLYQLTNIDKNLIAYIWSKLGVKFDRCNLIQSWVFGHAFADEKTILYSRISKLECAESVWIYFQQLFAATSQVYFHDDKYIVDSWKQFIFKTLKPVFDQLQIAKSKDEVDLILTLNGLNKGV